MSTPSLPPGLIAMSPSSKSSEEYEGKRESDLQPLSSSSLPAGLIGMSPSSEEYEGKHESVLQPSSLSSSSLPPGLIPTSPASKSHTASKGPRFPSFEEFAQTGQSGVSVKEPVQKPQVTKEEYLLWRNFFSGRFSPNEATMEQYSAFLAYLNANFSSVIDEWKKRNPNGTVHHFVMERDL